MADRSIDPQYLLSDEQVVEFVITGYHLVELDLPAGLNETICAGLDALTTNPLDEIITAVPQLKDVLHHRKLVGACASLLGHDYKVSAHRHWHCKPPHSRYMHWHQDGRNTRHTTVKKCLALYYPHDVTPDMGPTMVVPGTHFRNAPTDRMATYFNIRGQVPLTVKAGTVAITHFDIWHGTAANTTDRPRHMIKFGIDRQSEPALPAWNHDPAAARALAVGGAGGALGARLVTARPVPMGQTEHYKERGLRKEMFDWLCGYRIEREVLEEV